MTSFVQYNNGERRGDGIPSPQSMSFSQTWGPWCCFSVQPFQNGGFDFRDGVTADWSMSGMQSIDVILAEYLRWLGNLAEQVLKMYLVPGSST